jgi:hypothetical protein
LEVVEEFDHRRIRTLQIAATQRGVLDVARELVRSRLEVLDAHPVVCPEHLHPRLVPGVVLGDDVTQPRVVALVSRLPRLAVAELRLCFHHRVKGVAR